MYLKTCILATVTYFNLAKEKSRDKKKTVGFGVFLIDCPIHFFF